MVLSPFPHFLFYESISKNKNKHFNTTYGIKIRIWFPVVFTIRIRFSVIFTQRLLSDMRTFCGQTLTHLWNQEGIELI
jgi:hypothetical protein